MAEVFIVKSDELLVGAYSNMKAAQDHRGFIKERGGEVSILWMKVHDTYDVEGFPWGAKGGTE